MKKLSFFAFALCLLGIIAATSSVSTFASETVNYTEEDYNVIPDRYNSGVSEEMYLTAVEPGTYYGVTFDTSGSDLSLRIRKNRNLTGYVELNNLDFSARQLRIYDESLQMEPVVFVFNNCKFSKFRSFENGNSNVHFEFNNCSFVQCATSNTTFNSCYFGGGIIDGLIPYNNVLVNDSFFADKCMQNYTDTTGVHTDGTQIYGSKTAGCSNIHYENCRFEMPILKNAANAVNACIMLQIEYADATDISFNNCKVNGGGYSIYARACKQGTITNSSITNIKVGCSHKWGGFIYPDVDPEISLDNITVADTLYVGSVWKKNGVLHLSVTNDTNDVRKLLVKSSNGEVVIDIPACYTYNELLETTSYNDLPFDIDVVIKDADWVVCYDATEGEERQIRFVNFTDDAVVLNAECSVPWNPSADENYNNELIVEAENERDEPNNFSANENVVASGECGKAVTWTLVGDGTLYIEGYGEMENYHSKKLAPWTAYADKITTVVIADGVKKIGNQAFKYCKSLTTVILPESLEILGNNAFAGCSSLKEIVIPESVKEIWAYCFNGVRFENVVWNGICEVSNNNGNLETFR